MTSSSFASTSRAGRADSSSGGLSASPCSARTASTQIVLSGAGRRGRKEFMMAVREQRREFADPGFIRFLFGNKQMAWVWLVVRVYLGWQWLSAGWEKLHS